MTTKRYKARLVFIDFNNEEHHYVIDCPNPRDQYMQAVGLVFNRQLKSVKAVKMLDDCKHMISSFEVNEKIYGGTVQDKPPLPLVSLS